MYPIKLKPILKQHIWGGDTLLETIYWCGDATPHYRQNADL